MALDIVVFPHADLHAVIGGPPLQLRVMERDHPTDATGATDHTRMVLTEVTGTCQFDVFAPYAPVGSRLQTSVTIDGTGLVTPTGPGINLVQVRHPDGFYMIVRIQVHFAVNGWWFGNASITTARDATCAHAQPSLYALFSTDVSDADVVGDITGHGWVTLTSNHPATFSVDANGRLQGLAEGSGTLSGDFLGTTRTLPVRVVDYAKPRQSLRRVRSADRTAPQTKHNILFLPEAFRDTPADRERFDEIVTKAVDQMFRTLRHAPYYLLADSFNVWKAYEPSQQHGLTCGYRVGDEAAPGVLAASAAIPALLQVSDDATRYTPAELVSIVGLPLRGQTGSPAALTGLWSSQSLAGFVAARVDKDVADAWLVQRSVGILEARDSAFGLSLGWRYADRFSRFSSPPVLPPGADSATDTALPPFVQRMYEWFTVPATRTVSPDPRRHPPELLRVGTESIGISILRYIEGLADAEAPHAAVGPEWVAQVGPSAGFRRSRGLVVIVVNDALVGGTNFNASTLTATTIDKNEFVRVTADDSGNRRVRRRDPPDPLPMSLQKCIDTIAHELGHSFNLWDEYEEVPGDDASGFSGHDNTTTLQDIQLDPNFLTNRRLDASKVKWFKLPRILVSDTLTQASAAAGAQLRVTIARGQIYKWQAAKQRGWQAYLRHIDLPAGGRQLPQPGDAAHHLTALTIGAIDASAGTILLGGGAMPSPPPVFPAGSLLYVPRHTDSGELIMVVERKVLDKLTATNAPLNRDPDRAKVNKGSDHPLDIADFKPPCKSHKLIGVYEGAEYVTGMAYRPAGNCKMRDSADEDGGGEFCFVCKYLIVNRVDPALHALLDERHYPVAKDG